MKISIITINYNNLEGLKRTYESVVPQTCQDFEWIIIDGGSTDGSKEFIEEHQAHFAYWCSEPDKGIYNAMNKGVTHVTGEYVNFMNSGDTFHSSDVLQKFIAHLHKCDIVVGQVITPDKILNLPRPVDYWTVENGFCHQGTFTRANLLRKYPFDETFKISSDWGFFQRAILFNKCSVEFVDYIVADFDTTGMSSLPENDALMYEERGKISENLFSPLVCKELHDYKELRGKYIYKALVYIERYHHTIFIFTKKFISLIYKMILKAENVGALRR